jgi:hypothetical protein
LPRKPRTADIDWDGLAFRIANTGEIMTEIEPVDETGRRDYRAQAGEKAAQIRQLPIDYYVGSIIDGVQYDAANRLYSAVQRAASPNPAFTGIYIDNPNSHTVHESQLAAFDEVKGGLDAISPEYREVVHRVVIGRGQGPETIDAVRRRYSISDTVCKRLLCAGLDDLAGWYGLKRRA